MLTPFDRRSSFASDGAWLLLAEVNHRIGNEIQAALSALRCAKRGIGFAGESIRFIDDAVARLESFGDAHRLLDRQRRQGPLAERLEALCLAISRSKAAPLGIHIMLKLDEVVVDDEVAWTLCVVASELMTNAFKHAFPGSPAGFIEVALTQDSGGVVLSVTDNGAGAAFPSPSTVPQAGGLGSGIIARLADHNGGTVTRITGGGGTSVTFHIPAAKRVK